MVGLGAIWIHSGGWKWKQETDLVALLSGVPTHLWSNFSQKTKTKKIPNYGVEGNVCPTSPLNNSWWSADSRNNQRILAAVNLYTTCQVFHSPFVRFGFIFQQIIVLDYVITCQRPYIPALSQYFLSCSNFEVKKLHLEVFFVYLTCSNCILVGVERKFIRLCISCKN